VIDISRRRNKKPSSRRGNAFKEFLNWYHRNEFGFNTGGYIAALGSIAGILTYIGIEFPKEFITPAIILILMGEIIIWVNSTFEKRRKK